MSSKNARHRRLLDRARRRRHYIRIVRTIKRTHHLDGYVLGVGRRWVLLAVSGDGNPGGFVVLRIADIKKLDWATGTTFTKAAFRAQDAWPPALPRRPLDLDHGPRRLVTSAAAASPLVTIFTERADPDVCYIGRPAAWRRHKVHLHEVDTSGRWDRRTRAHRVAAITRVDIDGPYEGNLALLAGPESLIKSSGRRRRR